MPDLPSMESFWENGFGSAESNRPVFVYMTTSHPDLEEKAAVFERTVFIHEKLLIALKFFDAFMIDIDMLDGDDPVLEILDKPKPFTFFLF